MTYDRYCGNQYNYKNQPFTVTISKKMTFRLPTIIGCLRNSPCNVKGRGKLGKVQTKKFNLWFKSNHVLKDVDIEISEREVTAIMGPSGCGKSTLLRSINRMNDLIHGCKTSGEIMFDGKNIYGDDTNVYDIRRRIGMVFQRPNPFPKSIFDNVAFGP